jgi:carboxylate-amine ligase
LVCHVRSALEELGEYRAAVAMLSEVVRCGNGASRQRRALRKRNHMSDVTAMAAQSTLQVGRAAPSSGADIFSPPIWRDSPRVAVKNGLP